MPDLSTNATFYDAAGCVATERWTFAWHRDGLYL